MHKWMIGTALALGMVGIAHAAPGENKGQGNGRGNGNAERSAPVNVGSAERAQRGHSGAERGNAERGAERTEARRNDARSHSAAGRDGANGRGAEMAQTRRDSRPAQARGHDQQFRGVAAHDGRKEGRLGPQGDVRVQNDRYPRSFGLIDGCPPGLAKKNNGCTPPGLARHDTRRAYDDPRYFGYREAGRYLLGDGYLYRLGDGDRVTGFIPLLAGALGIGNVWPATYTRQRLPAYYQDYYNLGAPSGYAYADNVVYRLDPETAAIQSVAALMTGDSFVVGQAMPVGYDVYNVPAPYQSRYYDSPEAAYRYADGRVYRLDPETRLIQAAIELLS